MNTMLMFGVHTIFYRWYCFNDFNWLCFRSFINTIIYYDYYCKQPYYYHWQKFNNNKKLYKGCSTLYAGIKRCNRDTVFISWQNKCLTNYRTASTAIKVGILSPYFCSPLVYIYLVIKVVLLVWFLLFILVCFFWYFSGIKRKIIRCWAVDFSRF